VHALTDLRQALRATGAIREFTDEPVDDATLARVLDNARFAPSGGNRQGWRVIVLRDAEVRRRVRDLYLTGWYEYLALTTNGLVPWAPITDRDRERAAIAEGTASIRAAAEQSGGGFAEHIDEAPALLVVLADLRALAAVDRDHDRYTFAGGASIYPFCWSVLLAARLEGLGGVITTMPIREERAMKALLHIPAELAVAALIVLGHPVHQPTRLRRATVEEFTTVDTFDGPPFAGR
jgi:nitroreductase